MQRPWLTDPEVKRLDPIWDQVRREAQQTSDREPVLASLIFATILSEPSFEDAVCHRLAQRLEHSVDAGLLHKTFHQVLKAERQIGDMFRADLLAVAKRDPACRRLIDPLLYFKGYHALETHRFSHALWNTGRYGLCALSPEPLLTHPSGRYSPGGADRQGRDARPRHWHRHRRDGSDRRQLLDCCMASRSAAPATSAAIDIPRSVPA